MATPKYKKQYEEMLKNNAELFNEFKILHDDFAKSPTKFGKSFSELRRKVLRTIRKNEDMLCSKSEVTKFGVYSQGLADKFWEEIRANFPKIDEPVEE